MKRAFLLRLVQLPVEMNQSLEKGRLRIGQCDIGGVISATMVHVMLSRVICDDATILMLIC